jgi:hypothetical protein
MTFEVLLRFGHRVRQGIWAEFIAADAPSALPLTTNTAEAVGRRDLRGRRSP